MVSSQPQAALAPNGARLAGSRNTPAPMMLPTTSAAAIQKPSWRAAGASGGVTIAAAVAVMMIPSNLGNRAAPA